MDVSKRNTQKWLKPLKLIAKSVLLTFIFMIVMGISSGLAGVGTDGIVENASQIMGATLLVCFLQTVALSYPIVRSRLDGWRLVVIIAGVFFGVATFLVQIETLVFLDYFTGIIDPELIPKLFLQGALTAIIFTPIAVLLHRGWKNESGTGYGSIRLGMTWSQALVKVTLLAVIFVVFYVFFGIFVAWQNPAMGEYYGDLIAQMADVGNLMLLLQAGRAIVFVALAIPLIHSMKGRTWEKAIAVALIFSVLTSSNLLIPTTIMPDSVRMSHFIEVAIPGFVFGLLVVWLMHRKHMSLRDLFARPVEGATSRSDDDLLIPNAIISQRNT